MRKEQKEVQQQKARKEKTKPKDPLVKLRFFQHEVQALSDHDFLLY
jgi:hypothetical protein